MASRRAPSLEPVPPNTLLYSVIIPAFNEEQNIVPTMSGLGNALRAEQIPFELVVVNDNSRDNTAQVVEEARGAYPEIRLVTNDFPGGLGRAVRYGLQHFRGEVVAIVMADSSDSPTDVIRCYRKIEQGYDAVFGSRFRRGAHVTHYPLYKLFWNRIINKFLQILFMTKFNDLTNAFKVYRRHVIEAIQPLHAAHFNITIELSLSTLVRKFRIAEIPIDWSGRTWGQSNLQLRKMGRRYLATFLMIWFERVLILDDIMGENEAKSRTARRADPDAEWTVRDVPPHGS